MILWAGVLSAMMVSARVLAISTGHSRGFWLTWSAVVGLIAFISPTSGVAISVGNVFISLDDSSPLGLSVGQLAGAGAAVRFVLQVATRRVKFHQVWRPSHFALIGILFVVLLSALVSPVPRLPLAPLRKLVLIVLLYFLTLTYVNTFNKLVFLHLTLTLCAGITAILTFSQALTGTNLIEERAAGLTGNPNYQAIYLAVALPLVVSLIAYFKSALWRAVTGAIGAAIIGGVIATASRGGLLVLSISFVLVFMVWGRHGKRGQLLLAILLGVLMVSLTRSNIGDYALLRLDEAVSSIREGTAARTQSRVQLVDDSLEVWRQYPFVGVGAGNWSWAVNQLEHRAINVQTAHVWPMQLLAELGVLGVSCYIAFVLLCARDYQRTIHALDLKSSPQAHVVRGFFASALAMSLAWTSGNPYNQLWFELLMLGGVTLFISSHELPKNKAASGLHGI